MKSPTVICAPLPLRELPPAPQSGSYLYSFKKTVTQTQQELSNSAQREWEQLISLILPRAGSVQLTHSSSFIPIDNLRREHLVIYPFY